MKLDRQLSRKSTSYIREESKEALSAKEKSINEIKKETEVKNQLLF